MNTSDLVTSVFEHGYELIPAGDKVKYRGKGNLPDDLLSELRTRKQEVLQYLTAKEKLTLMAEELNWELEDLLDWYKSDLDMKDIARLEIPQLREFVRFYIENHELYRGEYA